MRLNQYLAKTTSLSRRQADQAILSQRVEINDRPARVGDPVKPGDRVNLNGQLLKLKTHRYIIFHKPVGFICSRRRQGATETIYDQLPVEFADLKPIGRLDKDSSGLVILTNDGDWAQHLAHPSYAKLKRYQVTLDRPLSKSNQAKLTRGIQLTDGPSQLILKGHGTVWQVDLSEGRNRQIRRSFGALGYLVTSLHREAIGEVKLGKLSPGQWLEITEQASK